MPGSTLRWMNEDRFLNIRRADTIANGKGKKIDDLARMSTEQMRPQNASAVFLNQNLKTRVLLIRPPR